METLQSMFANAWGWLSGTSSSFSFDGSTSGGDDSAGSPIFSYLLLGAAVILIVAVIFGELEDA